LLGEIKRKVQVILNLEIFKVFFENLIFNAPLIFAGSEKKYKQKTAFFFEDKQS